MDRLDAMSLFVTAVEAGSFSAASRQLDVPLATVSRKISDLETLLKARLLVRTTRKLTLTDAGAAYLNECRTILQQIAEAERAVAGEYQAPRGDLVITAPIVFGRLHLLPIINEFLATFPEIHVRLRLADATLHLHDDHIDLALRVGVLPDSSMVAITVGTVCRVVCASPAYFASHGTPQTISDLCEHACITFEAVPSGQAWSFTPSNGRPAEAVRIQPRLSVNTAEAAIASAIAGVGLTHVLSYQVAQAVEEGKLRLALREFEPEPIPVSLLHTGQKPMPLKTRSFIEFAAPRLQALLLGDKDRLRAGGVPGPSPYTPPGSIGL
jgi:DNA-binding transcriptional LysR family regulator